MTFKDYFSAHAGAYARYRPSYPPEVFSYVATLPAERHVAWDSGTGNGQAATGLAFYFDHVIATDPSEGQLQNAVPHEKIEYRVARAEEPGIELQSVDLVTAAQALHWFDRTKFFEEARRVLRPGGAIAVWCYTMCRITPELDTIIDRFYFDRVGPYWPKERRIVDDRYTTIEFPFKEEPTPVFNIVQTWDLVGLVGYIRTWSAVKLYIEQHGTDPVPEVEAELAEAWGNPKIERKIVSPVYMRAGRV